VESLIELAYALLKRGLREHALEQLEHLRVDIRGARVGRQSAPSREARARDTGQRTETAAPTHS